MGLKRPQKVSRVNSGRGWIWLCKKWGLLRLVKASCKGEACWGPMKVLREGPMATRLGSGGDLSILCSPEATSVLAMEFSKMASRTSS